MKQLLILLITWLSCSQLVKAEESFRYEETSWRIIRENLFNGDNSHVFRFKDDINFQVLGLKDASDSLFFIDLIAELDGLLETVNVILVAEDANFVVDLPSDNTNKALRRYNRREFKDHVISKVAIYPRKSDYNGEREKEVFLSYQIVRYLTCFFDNRYGRVDDYNIIFSSTSPLSSHFDPIDKDVLSKIYAADFDQQLRTKVLKKKGLWHYCHMRYGSRMNQVSYSLVVVLVIGLFLYFLSTESKRSFNPKLWTYIKERIIILIGISIACSMILVTLYTDFMLITGYSIVHFIAFCLGVFVNALLFCVFIYYSEKYGLQRIDAFVGQQLFVFLSTCLILFVVLPLLYSITSLSSYVGSPGDIFGNGVLSQFMRLILILLIAGFRVLYNVLNYKLKSMVNAKDVELAKMKELKHQAELNALHSRINPHFLYNSLNSIATLAHSDADKTEEMAIGLSDLFRYSINKEDKTFVTIADEMQMVERYLKIEKIRFAERLSYTITIDDKLKSVEIPKFMIQPIVENAIKHGVSKLKQKGEISVTVRAIDKDIEIAVYDNGPAFPDEPVGGYGLLNLNEKLEILYKDDASVNWVNGANKHFLITLKHQL